MMSKETLSPDASYMQVFKCLHGYVEQRYRAVTAYPNAPSFRFHLLHLETIRAMLKHAIQGTDYKWWASQIISRGTVPLFAIVTKTDAIRKRNEEEKIRMCLDILRVKTGRKAA